MGGLYIVPELVMRYSWFMPWNKIVNGRESKPGVSRAQPSFWRWDLRVVNLVRLAVGIGGLLTLLGFAGTVGWVFDLCAHFRVQYAVALVVAGIVLVVLWRRPWSGIVALALGAVNASCLWLLFWAPPAGGPASPAHRLLLANVNTYGGDPDRVADLIRHVAADYVVLEEISPEWLDRLADVLRAYPYSEADARTDNFGIGLFSRWPLENTQILTLGPVDVPAVAARFHLAGQPVMLVAMHTLPPVNADQFALRNAQLAAAAQAVRELPVPLLLAGDFNVTPWSPWFRRLLRASGLRDSARGYGWQPTWPAGLPWLWLPLDHCLYTTNLVIVSRQVGPAIGSDHYPLIVDFALAPAAGP